jgi:small-conductance mechanosensitive channel
VPLTIPEAIYIVVVLAVGTYALVRTLVFLRSSRQDRMSNVEKRRRFEAVRTKGPIDDPQAVAVERGLESIESHFSVLRRLLVPLIVGTTLILAGFPFIASTSASSASIVAAVLAVLLGLALRPFLENATAGLVICASRLVRIGDTVRIDDCYGTVEDITATHTTVKAWDWRRYLVPNSRMIQSTFFNYSLFDTYQWAYVEFWVAPDADLDEVREVAISIPSRSAYFSGSEEPKFWVIRIEKDAICCWVAAWADTPSGAWGLTNDVRTDLLRELRRRNVPLSLQRHRWSPDSTPAGFQVGEAKTPPEDSERSK